MLENSSNHNLTRIKANSISNTYTPLLLELKLSKLTVHVCLLQLWGFSRYKLTPSTIQSDICWSIRGAYLHAENSIKAYCLIPQSGHSKYLKNSWLSLYHLTELSFVLPMLYEQLSETTSLISANSGISTWTKWRHPTSCNAVTNKMIAYLHYHFFLSLYHPSWSVNFLD